jgi:hypothetical protein
LSSIWLKGLHEVVKLKSDVFGNVYLEHKLEFSGVILNEKAFKVFEIVFFITGQNDIPNIIVFLVLYEEKISKFLEFGED